MKKRIVSLLLCVVMTLTITPVTGWAENGAAAVSAFQQKALSSWVKPVQAKYLSVKDGREFGASRDNGGRNHAAIDYYVNNGANTPVFAMQSGTVIEYSSNFYGGTQAVAVQHADGSVARYCEIYTDLRKGYVTQGQTIGKMKANTINGGTMLHLELYLGTATGSLTQRGNTSYDYVVARKYNRRRDLLDPTFLLSLSNSAPIPVTRYSLELDYNNGSATQTDYNAGTVVTLPSDLKLDGYVFDGWYTERTGGTKLTSVTMNSNITVYAHWSPAVPAVPTFNLINSIYWAGQNVTVSWNAIANNDMYAINVYKDGVLIYEGGLYDTSYTVASVGTGSYVIYVSANNAAGTSGVTSCSFTVLQAQITYDANGGTGAPETQSFIPGGGYYFSTTVPIRDGYTFVNWKDAYNGLYYNPGDPIPAAWGSNTLVAQWAQIYYITYDANGGTGAPEAQPFLPGGGYYFSTTVPTRDGYTFVKWKDAYNGLYYNPGDEIPASWGGNILIAQWQPNTCYLDLSCYVDGEWKTSLTGYATMDVSIGGGEVFLQTAVDDFYAEYSYGMPYEIKNIQPVDGYAYDGVATGTRTGYLTENTAVALSFRKAITSLDEMPRMGVFNGHTYYYFHTPVTWYDAKAICENMGGHIVTINSAEENQFILDFGNFPDYASLIWLGATDAGTEGNWRWITGEPFEYTCWLENQPDNYYGVSDTENYMHLYDGTGLWNDNRGSEKFCVMCEVDTAEFTVAFDSNGGTGSMNAITGKYGELVTLSQNGYTKAGYNFAGWNMKRNLDNAWYTADDNFAFEDSIAQAGASKRVYTDGANMVFSRYDGSDTYTFVAVWQPAFTPGNVNGQGEADVRDMACLFDYLSTGKLSGDYKNDSAFFKAVADVNEDGVINILDYQALYELVKN